MDIKLIDFMELLTYNKLFEYVDIPSHIAAQILIDDPIHDCCFCEPINSQQVRIFYPIESWIKELKRRKEIETIITDSQMRPHKPTDKWNDVMNKNELQKLIISATLAGNFAEVQRLGELLNKK